MGDCVVQRNASARRLVSRLCVALATFTVACGSPGNSAPRAIGRARLARDAGTNTPEGDGGAALGREAATAIDVPERSEVRELSVVAHEDDDLLFVNPDILNGIRAGHEVLTIYLTAGNSDGGAAYWGAREDGVREAYAAMAGVTNRWRERLDPVPTGKRVEHFALEEDPRVSLVFLRLTDGDCDGSGFPASSDDPLRPPNRSLLGLWNDTTGVYSLPVVGTWATATSPRVSYTRSDLARVVSFLVDDFRPTRMHIQNPSASDFGCHGLGQDHADHAIGARFAFEAHQAFDGAHELLVHRGYDSNTEAPNLSTEPGGETAADELVFCLYAKHDDHVRNCHAYGNNGRPYTKVHYASIRVSGTGWLGGLDGKCLALPSENAVAGARLEVDDCVDVPREKWVVAGGVLRLAGTNQCVDLANASGANGTELRMATCGDSPTERWTLTSDGRLRGFRAKCVEVAGGDPSNGTPVELADCTDAKDATGFSLHVPIARQDWTIRFGPVTGWTAANGPFSDSAASGAFASDSSYYGSLRVGDIDGDGKADLCGRGPDGVYCALNDGTGSFGAASRYTDRFSDAAGWDTESRGMTLMLGDVDGDGKADVCGRDADAVRCATTKGSTLTPFYFESDDHGWTESFSDANGWAAGAEYYGSLRLADVDHDGYADLCGRAPNGIVCAVNDREGGFDDARTWLGTEFLDASGWREEQYGMTIAFGDINGDGRVDVCGRGRNTVFCAVGNERHDGFEHPRAWSMRTDFSDADGWNRGRTYYASIRLADVNGDGYADLCGRGATGIQCAFSNDLGFDRARRILPQDFTDPSWQPERYGMTIGFADLDGDGAVDVCGRGASTVSCARAPRDRASAPSAL